MKQIIFCVLICLLGSSCYNKLKKDNSDQAIPPYMQGDFEDDYGIQYKIDQEDLLLLPNDKFHILEVNRVEDFIILQNDSLNKFAPSLFTRIDFFRLEDMNPFEWAFCFSSYNEASRNDARKGKSANKSNLMKGCNGFPFSRMKRILATPN